MTVRARHQQHVLEHRADAELEAGARRGDPDRLAVDQDLAFVRLLHAGEDADQRRLAGAVLAQQHMDLARLEVERDAVIGDHAGEALGDVADRGDRNGQ